MKKRLIEKYGEKQALILLEKFNEDEIYENGFLEKELPEDDKWKQKFLDLEAKIKEMQKKSIENESKFNEIIKEKDAHISKLNKENESKRAVKNEVEIDKKAIEEQLNEYINKFDLVNKQFNELNEKTKDYDVLKEKMTLKEARELERKTALLQTLPEIKREVYSKLDYDDIVELERVNKSSVTPGLNNGVYKADGSSGINELINLIKG